MNHSRSYGMIRRAATALAVALLVASCNGTGINVAGGGIGGTGVTAVSVGPITKFGSIFVNGVEYRLTNATIKVNGQTVPSGDNGDAIAPQTLAVGQVVRVDAKANANPDGTVDAVAVTYSNDVKGLITDIVPDAVDPTKYQITVLNQTILVDSGTFIFRSTDHATALAMADLQAAKQSGTPVEVSGLINNRGMIHATSVEIDDAHTAVDGFYDIKGLVSNLNTNAKTFTVRGQLVDYSGANVNASDLSGGPYVEVKGDLVSGTLFATSITRESQGLGSIDIQKAEIEGFVTSAIDSNNQFDLDGQTVAIVTSGANATTFEPSGSTIADVVPGAKLEVEGGLTSGVLTAAKISIKSGSQD